MNEHLKRLFSLEGRVALVTGASGGIGSAIARAYAAAGATVALHGTREEKLRVLADQIAADGGSAAVFTADLAAGRAACRQLIEEIVARLGRLDILVNNAGINRRKPIAEVTEDDFQAILAVNLEAVYWLAQVAHPAMKANGYGRIVQIGSMTSFLGLGNLSVYGITKSALAQLTRTMAAEWAKDGIRVNCLAPGFIETPLTAQALFGDPHKREWILSRTPVRRPGVPDDLVGAALLLAAPAADFLTGQTLAVDGGFLAGGSWDNP